MRICRPFITVKGRRIDAKSVGKKAFCWEVTEEEHKAYLEKKAKEKKETKAKETSEDKDKDKNTDTEK
ncbi:hypothetical protein [Rossellomorea arthrocnemi]|uniref:hypothetical protein n=1 Tax=Rossellomorea arthrocnemi TaxID=2769542 RepID=UPI0019182C49|nr:hypothetical protein [Rossellomorea arthrocnemi]